MPRFAYVGILVTLVAVAGCKQATEKGQSPQEVTADSPAVPPEAPFAKQLEAVRAGESTEILCSKPVPSEQFGELTDGCDGLTVLELRHDSAADHDWSILESLPAISRLVIAGPVDDDDLESVANATSLEIVNLPGGTFTDDGLAKLTKLPLLTLLRFSSDNVTDDGMQHLPDMTNLRFIHLLDVPVTDDGLDPIKRMPMLESFYIDGGKCSEQGLECLLKTQPDLHIHIDQLHLSGHDHSHE